MPMKQRFTLSLNKLSISDKKETDPSLETLNFLKILARAYQPSSDCLENGWLNEHSLA